MGDRGGGQTTSPKGQSHFVDTPVKFETFACRAFLYVFDTEVYGKVYMGKTDFFFLSLQTLYQIFRDCTYVFTAGAPDGSW